MFWRIQNCKQLSDFYVLDSVDFIIYLFIFTFCAILNSKVQFMLGESVT